MWRRRGGDVNVNINYGDVGVNVHYGDVGVNVNQRRSADNGRTHNDYDIAPVGRCRRYLR